MEKQVQMITEFLDDVGGGYSTSNVKRYVEWNLRAKARLNEVLGLNLENGLTKVIPITMTNHQIMNQYDYLNAVIVNILTENKYHSIDFVAGTCKNAKGQEVRLTRIVPKFKEQIQEHPYYRQACQSLGILDYKFESLCPRLGELANSSNQELFVTSSIAEFMRVNYHSSYCSCYKHQACGGTSYWTGTLAYGTDDFTLLVGIRNKDTKYKTGRSWLWTFPDGIDSSGVNHSTPFMVQPKSYGEFSKLHRKTVREAIQECIQPGVWKLSSDEENTVRNEYRYGYIDNYNLAISYAKGETKPRNIYIAFDMSADDMFCINCGEVESLSDGTGECDSCFNEYYCLCTGCDDGISHEDDVYYGSDGNPYCESCYNENFFYCECCSETADHESSELVTGSRNGRFFTERVCEHCLSQDSSIENCADCGTYYFTHSNPLRETVDGEFICDDCSEGYCDCCDLTFASDSTSIDLANGKSYCESCAEDNTFVCVECGQLFDNDEVSETEGICEDCFENLKQIPLIADSECIREAA